MSPEASYTLALPGPLSPSAPPRRLDTVRRTSHLDMIRTRGDSEDGSLVIAAVRGGARDLVTSETGTEIRGQAALQLTMGAEGRIASVVTSPDDPSCADLVGARIGFGFRSQAKAVLQALGASPMGLLVDDLSGGTAASGYASIRERVLAGLPMMTRPVGPPPPRVTGATQLNVCAGWRAGGVPIAIRDAGEPMPMGDAPIAPAITNDDPDAWHDMPELEPGYTRRLRRIDLGAEPGRLLVDAMFRDICVDLDGTPRVVHEYALSATIDAATRLVLDIHADPRVLPFPTDCPLAAGHVRELIGHDIGGFRSQVAKVVSGPSSCTHLNDQLRSLADVMALETMLTGR